MSKAVSREVVLRTARFDGKAATYLYYNVSLLLAATVMGLPLLLLWLPFGRPLCERYLKSLVLELTPRTLKVSKGLWVRTEKTVPLDKITDMGLVQGPLLRHLGLHNLTVETAGQSAAGALVSLTGVIDAVGFREAVLAQRESLREGASEAQAGSEGDVQVQIRDALLRIEGHLQALRAQRAG